MDVAGVAVVVDRRFRGGEPVVDRPDRRQRLVPNVDEVERVERRVLVDRRYGGDRVADEAHAVRAERVLVLGDRENPERDRKVLARGDGHDARSRQRPRNVDRDDACVRDLRAQQLAVQHPRQHHVVGELRLARHLGRGVHLGVRAADDAGAWRLQNAPLTPALSPLRVEREHTGSLSRRERDRVRGALTTSPRAAARSRRNQNRRWPRASARLLRPASRRRRARRPRRS